MRTRLELETFIRKHIPSGWVGPIMDFDFAPHISDEDFHTVMDGKFPEGDKYDKWYVKEAIEKWQKQHDPTAKRVIKPAESGD